MAKYWMCTLKAILHVHQYILNVQTAAINVYHSCNRVHLQTAVVRHRVPVYDLKVCVVTAKHRDSKQRRPKYPRASRLNSRCPLLLQLICRSKTRTLRTVYETLKMSPGPGEPGTGGDALLVGIPAFTPVCSNQGRPSLVCALLRGGEGVCRSSLTPRAIAPPWQPATRLQVGSELAAARDCGVSVCVCLCVSVCVSVSDWVSARERGKVCLCNCVYLFCLCRWVCLCVSEWVSECEWLCGWVKESMSVYVWVCVCVVVCVYACVCMGIFSENHGCLWVTFTVVPMLVWCPPRGTIVVTRWTRCLWISAQKYLDLLLASSPHTQQRDSTKGTMLF